MDNLPEPGSVLRNGTNAVVVIADVNGKGDGVVLAVIPDNDVTPYVVWWFLVGKHHSSLYWGEYCKHLDEAAEEYKRRLNR